MSQSYRVAFAGDRGRESVVVKLASDNPTSRATGVGMGAYAREVAFYRQLAERIEGPLASCHLAIYDETDGWFTLVLEDLVGSEQGDQIAGCSVEQARIALGALARVHAPFLGDAHLGTLPWLNQASPIDQALVGTLLPGFLERYGERIAPEHAEVCRQFASVFDAWAADRRPPLGLVHGDFRLDNLLFDRHELQGRRLADGLVGPGDGRCRVPARRRLEDSGATCARAGADPRLPLAAAGPRRARVLVGHVLGGIPTPERLRADDDDRRVDGRRQDRARR